MTEDDLFPGFETRWHKTSGGRLHAMVGGPEGAEAVLLLHGFPQSSVSWHPLAGELSRDHRVVCLDLKGYGRSDAPRGDGGRSAYTKRVMASEAVQVMAAEGYEIFTVIGHDRGAQVAYRMALDSPNSVTRLGILDNLPVYAVWELIDATPGALPHWTSLARTGDDAEHEITDPFLMDLLRAHTADGSLERFDPMALALYRRTWAERSRIHAFAEDYRAGATTDRDDDLADLRAGRTVTCPSLIMWGEVFLGRLAESPLDTWRRSFTPNAVGIELACGHFLIEEAPDETLTGLRQLLAM